jgi:hypothetical protein
VDPAEEGILPGDTLDDIGSQPTEELNEGSIFDENLEILALEKVTLTTKSEQNRMRSKLTATQNVSDTASQMPGTI